MTSRNTDNWSDPAMDGLARTTDDTGGVDYSYNPTLDTADGNVDNSDNAARVTMVGPTGVQATYGTATSADTDDSTFSGFTPGPDDVSALDQDDATMETEAIRSEIEQTRSHMSETINQIQDRLNPQHLVDQAKTGSTMQRSGG